VEWNFSNLEIFHISFFNKNQLNRIFIILPVSSSVCNKKIFMEKYGVTGLVFKIGAIDSKKWVKFVAVQQDSATLIYDLNIMKSTVESDVKNSTAIQNSTVPSLKNRT